MTHRLTAEMRAQGLIRLAQAQGLFAALRHRGEAERGALLVKLDRFDAGCLMLEPVTGFDGAALWRGLDGPAVASPRAEEIIAKRRRVDTDLWVIEIEDPKSVLDPAAWPA
ncbi:hypothetical protein CCR85_07230 [Rhodothalassium salexigens]|uniref:DUF1491 family protein n=1 Tax=Rhodothalassium salexigens TaxID=1086 RepID=UPI001912656B|nr:DUF1491 family protein [Rhodothalassium salexigens]MBK5911284.1 hypothetical protein [Rhodothalassium salexigens]